jgi:hypothetical protein
MSNQHDFYGIPPSAEERERSRAEQQRRSEKMCAPAPEPIPVNAQRVLDGFGRAGIDYDERFPPQIVQNLPDPAPRGPGGELPWEDSSISEADKIKAARSSPARIDALEARVAKLEDIVRRQFGGALSTEGQVYR